MKILPLESTEAGLLEILLAVNKTCRAKQKREEPEILKRSRRRVLEQGLSSDSRDSIEREARAAQTNVEMANQ